MFEKVGQLAERVATSVSRRDFLGRFGRGAMAVAAAAAGLLALPNSAQAAAQYCDVTSEAECIGKKFGSRCVDASGPGRCKNFGNINSCYCG
jgi:hypothetical protein